MNPFTKFHNWHTKQLKTSKSIIPSACCLSTIGTDGYPNARFVSLKEVKNETFIITGPLRSRKGTEIAAIPKVALTFWWPDIKRQVRIQGDAFQITQQEADKYFDERSRESCIISYASKQGEILKDIDTLNQAYQSIEQQFQNKPIPRPDNWGGFYIVPVRIEFLKFEKDRFHKRMLYEKHLEEWKYSLLQP